VPHLMRVILSEAKDLAEAADCLSVEARSFASLRMTPIDWRCRPNPYAYCATRHSATPTIVSRVTIFSSCSALQASVPLGRIGSTR